MVYFYIVALIVTFLGVVINLPGTVHINPILLNFYDAKTVLFLTAIFMTFGSLCRIIVFRKEIVKENLMQIILWAILGGLAGSAMLGYINDKILIILFLFSGFKFLYEYYKKKSEEKNNLKNNKDYVPEKPKNKFLDIFITGFIASFLQVFGIGTGPIRQGYYISKGYGLAATQGTVGFMFFFTGLAIISTRIIYGGMDLKLIYIILPLFPFMLAIVYMGKFVIYKIPKVWQDRIIIYSLVVSLISVLPKLINFQF